jgi:hypothetical protein
MSKHQHTPASAAVGIEHAIRMLEGSLEARDSVPSLRQLERDGIVARIVHAQVPPKVEYHLTKWGQSLCPALDEILTWAERQPSSPSSSQSAKPSAIRAANLTERRAAHDESRISFQK